MIRQHDGREDIKCIQVVTRVHFVAGERNVLQTSDSMEITWNRNSCKKFPKREVFVKEVVKQFVTFHKEVLTYSRLEDPPI